MVGVLLLLIILFIINQILFLGFAKQHRFFSKDLANKIFLYHLVFALIYYAYTIFNRSDSGAYFNRTLSKDLWWNSFRTGTPFIDFISWPFINILSFNYEMMMLLFSWFGYIGFIYAYLFFRENIPVKVKILNVDLLTLLLFLPNMHFWTASLGKGAPIFMSLMMFVYAIKDPKRRWLPLLIGAFITYFIRPHVFLFVAAGTVLGFMTGNEKMAFWKKLIIYFGLIGSLILVQDTILEIAGLNETENLIEGFEDFSGDRATELAKSGSGVDMANYPLILKLFTFWFRPLFLDAPGLLGLIVSLENLFYLFLFIQILKKDFIGFLKRSPISVKMSLTIFLLASLALSFVMSNLGIIMRQKSMVMYFLFFVIYYYLAQKKYDKILQLKKLKKLRDLELNNSR